MKVKLTLSAAAKRIRALEADLQAHATVIDLLFERYPQCRAMGYLPGYVDQERARWQRDRALLLEITYKGAALPVVRAAMRWYRHVLYRSMKTPVVITNELGPLEDACARLKRARERERKRRA